MTAAVTDRGMLSRQAGWYLLAGTCATALHAGLFLLLRGVLGPFPANLLAITVTATANVEFHHRVTFRPQHGSTARRLVAIGGTVLYDATYSSAALLLLELFVTDPTATQQTVVIVAAAAAGGIARFALLRVWVFADPARSRAHHGGLPWKT